MTIDLKKYCTFISFLSILGLHAQNLPQNFVDEVVSDNWTQVVKLDFDANGRIYVCEKGGRIHIVDTNGVALPNPLIDISDEVLNWRDHGLLGFVLHPDFLNNGYFYLLYVVDRYHLDNYGTANYNPHTTYYGRATIGRLTRYTADPSTNFTTVIPNSRMVLLGQMNQPNIVLIHESHGVGSLVFGADGSLLVSAGDGNTYNAATIGGDDGGGYATDALNSGIMTPDLDIGSYRCQYLGSLNGKILRIDPINGGALPSNPFYEANNPTTAQSLVYAMGLRNPFRFTVKPNTGSHDLEDGNPGVLYIGDVGGGAWEEINIADKGGLNFGYPTYEGKQLLTVYDLFEKPKNPLAPNSLFGGNCAEEYFNFRDLLKRGAFDATDIHPNPCDPSVQIPDISHKFIETPPVVMWNHSDSLSTPETYITTFDATGMPNFIEINAPISTVVGPSFSGNCAIGGAFYMGSNYPNKYYGTYFGANYDDEGWIRAFYFDSENQIQSIEDFHQACGSIVYLRYNPHDENLYYINYENEIRRIKFGEKPFPKANIQIDQAFGTSPLIVQFDASHSNSLIGGDLIYSWDFGDGSTSSAINPTHTFETNSNTPIGFEVKLIVTDTIGNQGIATQIIALNNTPPMVNITSIEEGSLFPTHQTSILELIAEVSDLEHGESELNYEWQTILHHNEHIHPESIDQQKQTTTIISPVGCGAEIFFYEVQLTVTDAIGLSTTDSKRIYPNCNDPFVEIINLEATKETEQVRLNWTTVLENNTTHFEIQKAINHFNFNTIGTVISNAIPSSYSFIDESLDKGYLNYRIKAFDNQGFDYSNIVTLEYPAPDLVTVFPNPASDFITIRILEAVENVQFQFYNALGQAVFLLKRQNLEEDNHTTILTTNFTDGVYFYTILIGEDKYNGKIMIKK